MSIQASISNRSWFKAQWAKLLVFIALIVPLLGMKKGNQGAEAGGEFKPLKRSGSLRLHSSLPKQKASEEVSLLEVGNQPTTDLSPTSFFQREWMQQIKDDFFPLPRGREGIDTRLRKLAQLKDRFEHRNVADTKERDDWLQLTMDLIRGGHFDFAGSLMLFDPSFFNLSGTDLAFSNEALAQLAKKTEVESWDLENLDFVIKYSGCAEWKDEAKLKESCKHIEEIQRLTSDKDQGLFTNFLESYNHRVNVCGGTTHSKTECSGPFLKLPTNGKILGGTNIWVAPTWKTRATLEVPK